MIGVWQAMAFDIGIDVENANVQRMSKINDSMIRWKNKQNNTFLKFLSENENKLLPKVNQIICCCNRIVTQIGDKDGGLETECPVSQFIGMNHDDLFNFWEKENQDILR